MEGSPAVWLLLAMLVSYSGLSEKQQLQIFCLVISSPGLLFTPMNYLMSQQDTNLGNVGLTRELQGWTFPTCCHWDFFVAFYWCRTATITGSDRSGCGEQLLMHHLLNTFICIDTVITIFLFLSSVLVNSFISTHQFYFVFFNSLPHSTGKQRSVWTTV